MHLIRREELVAFLGAVAETDAGGPLSLVGGTSQLFESWVPTVQRLTVAASPDRPELVAAVEGAARHTGVVVLQESPADVVPLPPGAAERARPIEGNGVVHGSLQLFHYDPYSVSLRLLARGDEDDYHVVLAYLQHEWMDIATMDELVAAVLPSFTREAIEQDPAEFRRKYRGLHQMWRAQRP